MGIDREEGKTLPGGQDLSLPYYLAKSLAKTSLALFGSRNWEEPSKCYKYSLQEQGAGANMKETQNLPNSYFDTVFFFLAVNVFGSLAGEDFFSSVLNFVATIGRAI